MSWRRALVALLAIIGFAGIAEARTINIIEAERLEFRNVTPPGTTEVQEYVIITGQRVYIKIDEDELEATRVEYNRTTRRLYVVGAGTYRTASETVRGHDFSVNLDTEGLVGEDVIIATSQIDVIGVSVERIPGQIDVQNGYFSPCGRCGQTPNDYAFRAEELVIYPGDRLIARNVTLLLSDEPVMWLPIVVLFLNDPARQPRLEFRDEGVGPGKDGYVLEADLPFVTGSFGLGFTMLRYYERRNPPFGFGVDYSLYNLFDLPNRARLFFLVLPPTLTAPNTGALFAYYLNATGSIPLTPGAAPEDAWPPITYSATVTRTDSGIPARELRGVPAGPNKRTDFDLRFGIAGSLLAVDLVANGFIDNRDLAALTPEQQRAGLPYVTQFQPELRGRLVSPQTFGPFTLNRFSFSAGRITAPFDPLNRSAAALAGKSPYVTAFRVVDSYNVSLNLPLWTGATVTASQDFTGQYYSTRNPAPGELNGSATGELERAVSTAITANFEQRLFGSGLTIRLGYAFSMAEGESPFAFDRIPRRPISEAATFSVSAQPFPWLGFTVSERYDFRRQTQAGDDRPFRLDPATLTVNLTPQPVNATASVTYDLERGEPVLATVSASTNLPGGFSFSVRTGIDYATTPEVRRDPTVTTKYQDLVVSAGYTVPGGRFSTSVSVTHNLNTGEVRSASLNATATVGPQEQPFTLTTNETLTPPQILNAPASPQPFARLAGSVGLGYLGQRLTLTNNLDFTPWAPGNPSLPRPPSTLNLALSGTIPGGPTYNLAYGGNLDLEPITFYNPTVTGSLSITRTAIDLALAFSMLAPSQTQPNFELNNASFTLGWDLLPGVSLSGAFSYSRSRGQTAQGFTFNDTFNFTPLNLTFALAREGQAKPEVYITARLRGTYTYRSTGGLPIFSNGTETFESTWRPIFVLTIDRCCWAVQLTFDTTPKAGASFTLSFVLPTGSQNVIQADPTGGIRFPAIPIIPPIGVPPQEQTPGGYYRREDEVSS